MKVGEMCMRDVAIAFPDEDVVTAARRMRHHHVGSIVVVEDEDGDRYPVGMVTDRDLILVVLARDVARARDMTVQEVMSKDLVTAREQDDLYYALQWMRGRGIRRLPVVDDDGRLAGILTFDDILEWVSGELGELTRIVERGQSRERSTVPEPRRRPS